MSGKERGRCSRAVLVQGYSDREWMNDLGLRKVAVVLASGLGRRLEQVDTGFMREHTFAASITLERAEKANVLTVQKSMVA